MKTVTARLLGDPDPDRHARSEAIKARFPVPTTRPYHSKKLKGATS